MCIRDRSDRPPTQHKAADIGGVFPAIQTDAHHDGEEHQQHTQLDTHFEPVLSSNTFGLLV